MEPMQITGYSDGQFKTPTGSVYSLMLNPDSLKWNRSIEYNAKRTPGASSPSQKYLSTPSDKLSFEIAQKIQTEMTYPGQVKVTVIRETRSVNFAK